MYVGKHASARNAPSVPFRWETRRVLFMGSVLVYFCIERDVGGGGGGGQKRARGLCTWNNVIARDLKDCNESCCNISSRTVNFTGRFILQERVNVPATEY